MRIHHRHFSSLRPLATLLTTVLLGACNESSKTGNNVARNSQPAVTTRIPADSNQSSTARGASAENSDEPYFGEINDERFRTITGSRQQSDAASAGSAASAASAAAAGAATTWSLVLGTFTGEGHAQAAREMIDRMRLVTPQVAGARVHSTPRGSMVVYGHYAGRDDPQAVKDEQWLKSITYQNRQAFRRIILTHIDQRLARGELHPNDLLSARKAHPTVNPLYTLDVAIWMSNEDPKAGRDRLTFDEVKRRAESYAADLRARGEQAYFYHDEVNRWSVVTVGLFDRRAIDIKSGLYSADVDALIRRFPVRLANGEPLMEFRDRFNPKFGAVPQRPKLVLVPTM